MTKQAHNIRMEADARRPSQKKRLCNDDDDVVEKKREYRLNHSHKYTEREKNGVRMFFSLFGNVRPHFFFFF